MRSAARTQKLPRKLLPTLRQFSDLDILVATWDYHFRVAELLASHGWRLTSDYGWGKTFMDVTGRIRLDVHERVADREIPVSINFNRIWKRCLVISLLGASVRTFAPSDLLIILCVQLAKDAAPNKNGIPDRIPLIKVCDIAELLTSRQHIDWKWVFREAGRLGILRIVYVGIRTACDLLRIDVPKEVLQKKEATQSLDSLVTHVGECVLGRIGRGYSHPELLEERRYYSEMLERAWDRVHMRHVYWVTPNVLDYSFLRLPRRLFPLYYLVRPIRIVCKYMRREWAPPSS